MEWTLNTLHEHFTKLLEAKEKLDAERFNSLKSQTEQALASADKAVLKSETAANLRFEGVNEFRNTLADQQRTLIPRSEVELSLIPIKEDIKILKDINAKNSGKGEGFNQGWLLFVGIISLVAVVFSLISYFK